MSSRRSLPDPGLDDGQAPTDGAIGATTISEFEAFGEFTAGFEATQMHVAVAGELLGLGGANDAVGVVRRPLRRTAFVPVAWIMGQWSTLQ